MSTSYLSLIQARKDAGDAAGATKDAEAWAAFLEAQAAAAKTPEQRAVFDSHRLSAYLELKQPERAIPMLQAVGERPARTTTTRRPAWPSPT